MVGSWDRRGRIRKRLTMIRHPELISHIISVCTPYIAPDETYISPEDVVKG
jgi:hypothetical protein